MDQDEGGELGEVHEGLNRCRVGAAVFLFVSCNCSSGSLSVISSILCTWGDLQDVRSLPVCFPALLVGRHYPTRAKCYPRSQDIINKRSLLRCYKCAAICK